MNKYYILTAIILLITTENVLGQTAIFQDSEGKSSILILQDKFTLNTASKSLELSLDSLSRKDTMIFKRTGLSVKVNSNEGKAQIFNKGDFILDGSLSLYKGFKISSIESSADHEIYFSGSVLFSRDKLYDLDNISDVVETNENIGLEIQIGYSGYRPFLLYGLSLTSSIKNNSQQLSLSSVKEITATSNNSNIEVVNIEEAYDKIDYIPDAKGYGVLADIAFDLRAVRNKKEVIPSYVAMMLRYSKIENSDARFSPAIGYFIGEEGKPKSIRIGINWQFIDLLGEGKESPIDNSIINITAGFPF